MLKTSSFLLLGSLTLGLVACTPTSAPATSPSPSPASIETSDQTTATQISQAMMTGQPLHCTISNTTQGDSIEFYTKNKMMRVTSMMASNQELPSHMINDGEYMYVWTQGQPTGMKSRMPSEEELQKLQGDLEQPANQTAPDFSDPTVQERYSDQGYTIECLPEAIADDQFVPPTDVTFQDFSAMMDSAMQGIKRPNEAE